MRALIRSSRRGRSPRQVPPHSGGCAPKGGLQAALPTSALSPSRLQAGFPGAAAPDSVGCLYFSCSAKKSTQKNAGKGEYPFAIPRISLGCGPFNSGARNLHTLAPQHPLPFPGRVSRPGRVHEARLARYCWGRPHVGADAHIRPSLRPARRRSPGVTSNKGGRSPPCAWSVGGGCQEGEYEIPLLTASLVTFCASRKSPPGGCRRTRADVGIGPYGSAAESAACP